MSRVGGSHPLRIAFHALWLEAAPARASGWTIRHVRPERLAAGDGPTLARIRTGMGPEAARRAVSRLAPAPVEAALLGGFAGGLDPEIAPGTVVVADPLLDEQGRAVAAPLASELERAAHRAGLSVRRGPLVSVARVAATLEAKRELRARTGALAVDMESAALAEALAARGVPAGAARVVLDAAREALPARGAGWSTAVGQAASWLRIGARIPGAARTSARLLGSWLAEAGKSPPGATPPAEAPGAG